MKKVHSRFLVQDKAFFRLYGVGRIFQTPCTVGIAGLLVSICMIPAAWAAGTTSPVPPGSGYEISLGELNKVKKERPVKKEIKEHKRKKSESAVKRPALEAVVPPGAVITVPAAASNEAGKVVAPDPLPSVIPSTSIAIHHDPYSFVVKGKRTIIQAVISSADSIQTVYCRFRATESGSYAIVPMLQAQGTLFTYVATLPSLEATSRALRYSIVAVDSSGNEARSQEFVIAVKASTVLPGWQLENSGDKIKIRLENKGKPLEGFSDAGIIE